MPLQTVPHFQKSGEVFNDTLLKACFGLCKEPGTTCRQKTWCGAHIKTFCWSALPWTNASLPTEAALQPVRVPAAAGDVV